MISISVKPLAGRRGPARPLQARAGQDGVVDTGWILKGIEYPSQEASGNN
jgi:hypothetical protein